MSRIAMISFAGGQVAPNWLLSLHFRPDIAFFVYTPRTKEIAENLEASLKIWATKHGEFIPQIQFIPLDEETHNYALIRDQILKYLQNLQNFNLKETSLILNITSGRKPMTIALWELYKILNSQGINTRVVYLDVDSYKVNFIEPRGYFPQELDVEPDIESYLRSNGYILKSSLNAYLKENEKLKVALIHTAYALIGDNMTRGLEILKREKLPPNFLPTKMLAILTEEEIIGEERDFKTLKKNRMLNSFWWGEWLSFGVLGILEEIEIENMVMGAIVEDLKGKRHEIDFVFFKGYRPYFIECKSGKVKSDEINKFLNIVSLVGGRGATPILVSAYPSGIARYYSRLNFIYADSLDELQKSIEEIIGISEKRDV